MTAFSPVGLNFKHHRVFDKDNVFSKRQKRAGKKENIKLLKKFKLKKPDEGPSLGRKAQSWYVYRDFFPLRQRVIYIIKDKRENERTDTEMGFHEVFKEWQMFDGSERKGIK